MSDFFRNLAAHTWVWTCEHCIDPKHHGFAVSESAAIKAHAAHLRSAHPEWKPNDSKENGR